MNKDTSEVPLTEPLDSSNGAGDPPPVDGGPWIRSTGEPKPPPSKDFKHIDDFLECTYEFTRWPDLAYPHFLFTYWRSPATTKMLHAPFMNQFKLFVDFEGQTWRVTGASRMGDIWLAKDFNRVHGYDRRVNPNFELFTNWRDKADWELSLAEKLTLATAAGMTVQGDPLRSHKAADYLKRWAQGNKIPDRYVDLSPEQRQILQIARFKRSMDATNG